MTTLAALPDLEGLTLAAVAPASDRAVLRARLLGDLDVRLNGVPVQLGRSAKARGLLAFLIDRGSRPIPRDLLMDVFWPASAPGAARNSLHVALHGVRKVLARAWPGEVIACRGDTYRLSDRIEVWSDVAELDRHSAQARIAAADGRTEEALAECEAALEPVPRGVSRRRSLSGLGAGTSRGASPPVRRLRRSTERAVPGSWRSPPHGDAVQRGVAPGALPRACRPPADRRLRPPRATAHGPAGVRADRRRPGPAARRDGRPRDREAGRGRPRPKPGLTVSKVTRPISPE